jgi:hypothetical protein
MFLSAIQISNFFRCIYKISVFEVGANIFVRNVSNPELSTSCLKHAFLSCQYQMKILNIFEIFSYQVSCFIFQHNNNPLPQPIASLFTINSEMHHHNTRQKT